MSEIQELIADSTIKAFNQGVAHERQRLLTFLESKRCECIDGYPEEKRYYYKTSGNQTRESLQEEWNYISNHQYCDMLSYSRTIQFIKGVTDE